MSIIYLCAERSELNTELWTRPTNIKAFLVLFRDQKWRNYRSGLWRGEKKMATLRLLKIQKKNGDKDEWSEVKITNSNDVNMTKKKATLSQLKIRKKWWQRQTIWGKNGKITALWRGMWSFFWKKRSRFPNWRGHVSITREQDLRPVKETVRHLKPSSSCLFQEVWLKLRLP